MHLAWIILLIVVGLYTPNDTLRYDLSGNGTITAYDATLALRAEPNRPALLPRVSSSQSRNPRTR